MDEIWIKKREEALIRDNYTCVVCGSRKSLEVYHIIPYRLVGKHEVENLVTLCEKCHHKFEKDSIELLKGKIGHPDFTRLLVKVWMLYVKKNYQYATSKDPLANFRRCGKLCEKLIKVDNKPLAIALFCMSKQVDAVYEVVGENKKDTVEQLEDKLLDIAVYSLLCIILNKEGNM